MKNILILVFIFVGSIPAFGDGPNETDLNQPAILNGRLADVEKLTLNRLEVFSAEAGVRPPTLVFHLIATVYYSTLCQTPASFVVVRNAEPYTYSVIEAHAPLPKDRVTCKAMNRVELKILVDSFAGLQPQLDLIRVNGISIK